MAEPKRSTVSTRSTEPRQAKPNGKAEADGDSSERLSIGELAKLTSVSSRTVRYYEGLGILPEPERSPGGTRRYPPEHKFYIEGALALKEVGFSLEEIRLLGQFALDRPISKADRVRATEIIRSKMQALEHKIRVLEHLRDNFAESESKANSVRSRRELTKVLQTVREQDPSAARS
jgi:DNA-binding transcriptional MerR regulator